MKKSMFKKSGLRNNYVFRKYLIVGLAAVGLVCTSIEAANLKQYWSFSDGSGSVAANAVAGGNAGVLYNYATHGWSSDVPDALAHRNTSSLQFNSSANNYVNGGALAISVTGGVDGVTISAWIKPSTISTDTRLFSQLRQTRTAPHPTGAVRLVTDGSDGATLQISGWANASPIGAVKANQWQHLCLVWCGRSVKTFLNGKLSGGILTSFEYDLDSAGDPIEFGIGSKYALFAGTPFDGKMSDVAVWNTTLSPVQIRRLVAGESPLTVEEFGPEHVLPLHWGFEDGSGQIATNSVAGNATANLVDFGSGAWDSEVPAAIAGHSAFSLAFDGSSSAYLDCGYLGISSTNNNYGATVSMWIKPQVADDTRLFSLNRPTTTRPHPAGNVRLNTNSLGQVFLEIGSDVTWLTLSSPDAIKTNQWQHLALTWRGNCSCVEAFVDGKYIGCALGSLDADRDANNDLVNFSIGRQYFNSGNFYQGKIDDLSIWDVPFCESQIQALAAGVEPLSVSPVVASPSPLSASNPLVQYRMDGDAEAKPELYNGTAYNGASFTAGEDDTPFAYNGNMALSLDGIDDEMTMPVAGILQPGTNAWSLALWFKTGAFDQKTTLLSNRPGNSPFTQMSIYLGGTDSGTLGNGRRIHYLIMEGTIANSWEGVTQMDFADDNWHHLVLVRPGEGRIPSLYVDGELAAVQMLKTATSEPNINTVAPFKIGASTDPRLNYNGFIDEVAMWNSALSFEEVRWLSQNSLADIMPDGTMLFLR